ncbi:uncharacterized protein YjdB [Oerskovia jenensis]|uniref:Uncharacterized protein YjdB n=1 Tax=Oerskovia jenensis TaxID=162169 RepID=A0ABS2LGH1_9CELL|nr:hypothetical protein [Oerskovia jenensis]MBM7479208.1 uncharacterized protein YjdB [Oerskovia jenensis]
MLSVAVAATVAFALVASGSVAVAAVESDPGATGTSVEPAAEAPEPGAVPTPVPTQVPTPSAESATPSGDPLQPTESPAAPPSDVAPQSASVDAKVTPTDLMVGSKTCGAEGVTVDVAQWMSIGARVVQPGRPVTMGHIELRDRDDTVAFAHRSMVVDYLRLGVDVPRKALSDGATYTLRTWMTDVDDASAVGEPLECTLTVRLVPQDGPAFVPALGREAVYVYGQERGGVGVPGAFLVRAPTEEDIVALEMGIGSRTDVTTIPVTGGPQVIPFVPRAAGPTTIYVRWVDRTGLFGPYREYPVHVAGASGGAPTPPALTWSLPVVGASSATVPVTLTLSDDLRGAPMGEISVRRGERTLARVAVTEASHQVELDRAVLGSGNVPVTIEYVTIPGDTPWTTEAVVCGADCTLSPGEVGITGGTTPREALWATLLTPTAPLPTHHTYQWLVDGQAIEGEVEQTFVAPPWFEGRAVTVEATAHRPGYDDVTITSEEVVLEPVEDPSIRLQAKVQGGWAAETGVDGRGITSVGTTGKGRELRGLRAWKVDPTGYGWTNTLSFSAHVREQGWLAPVPGGWSDIGDPAGVQPLEAFRVEFSGMNAEFYDVYYRAHVGGVGWLGWAKNGEVAGTVGYGAAIEAVEVTFVRKVGQEPPAGNGMPASYERGQDPNAQLRLQAHVENIGWQGEVSGGQQAGTTAQRLRVEALKFRLEGPVVPGGVRASAHVQDIGWQPFATEGEVVGTTGRALQVEAFKIELTGQMAQRYDIYYRTHAQDLGWLGWAKNGAPSGSAGYFYRLEAVEVRLVPKGLPGPDTPGVPAFKQR